jgi:hypothetical protein
MLISLLLWNYNYEWLGMDVDDNDRGLLYGTVPGFN